MEVKRVPFIDSLFGKEYHYHVTAFVMKAGKFYFDDHFVVRHTRIDSPEDLNDVRKTVAMHHKAMHKNGVSIVQFRLIKEKVGIRGVLQYMLPPAVAFAILKVLHVI